MIGDREMSGAEEEKCFRRACLVVGESLDGLLGVSSTRRRGRSPGVGAAAAPRSDGGAAEGAGLGAIRLHVKKAARTAATPTKNTGTCHNFHGEKRDERFSTEGVGLAGTFIESMRSPGYRISAVRARNGEARPHRCTATLRGADLSQIRYAVSSAFPGSPYPSRDRKGAVDEPLPFRSRLC